MNPQPATPAEPQQKDSDEFFVLADRSSDRRIFHPAKAPVAEFVVPLALLAGLFLAMALGVTSISAGTDPGQSEAMLETQRALAERRATLLQNCVVLLSSLLGGFTVYFAMRMRRN